MLAIGRLPQVPALVHDRTRPPCDRPQVRCIILLCERFSIKAGAGAGRDPLDINPAGNRNPDRILSGDPIPAGIRERALAEGAHGWFHTPGGVAGPGPGLPRTGGCPGGNSGFHLGRPQRPHSLRRDRSPAGNQGQRHHQSPAVSVHPGATCPKGIRCSAHLYHGRLCGLWVGSSFPRSDHRGISRAGTQPRCDRATVSGPYPGQSRLGFHPRENPHRKPSFRMAAGSGDLFLRPQRRALGTDGARRDVVQDLP